MSDNPQQLNFPQVMQDWLRKDFTALTGNLEGQWLTLIDATFSDKEQRKAMKDVVRKMIWDWNTGIIDTCIPDRKTAGVDPDGRPTY